MFEYLQVPSNEEIILPAPPHRKAEVVIGIGLDSWRVTTSGFS